MPILWYPKALFAELASLPMTLDKMKLNSQSKAITTYQEILEVAQQKANPIGVTIISKEKETVKSKKIPMKNVNRSWSDPLFNSSRTMHNTLSIEKPSNIATSF